MGEGHANEGDPIWGIYSNTWLTEVGDECVIFSLSECGIKVEKREIVVLETETFEAPVYLSIVREIIGGLIIRALCVKIRHNMIVRVTRDAFIPGIAPDTNSMQ